MASSRTDDWQVNKSVLESNKHMLENQLFCDVTFAFNCKRKVGKVKRNRNVHCIVTSCRIKASLLTILSLDTYSL